MTLVGNLANILIKSWIVEKTHLLRASQHSKAFRFVITLHTFQFFFIPLGTLVLSPLLRRLCSDNCIMTPKVGVLLDLQ